MTTLELIDLVMSKLGEPAPIAGPEIEGVLSQALYQLARRVADSPDRELLKKDFSVTVTNGVGDLSDSLEADEPLLLECIKHAEVYGTGHTTPWQFLPDKTQLGLSRPALFIYFTVNKQNLLTRNIDGNLSSLGTTATITASYVPTIENVVIDQLKDELVDTVIGLLNLAPVKS